MLQRVPKAKLYHRKRLNNNVHAGFDVYNSISPRRECFCSCHIIQDPAAFFVIFLELKNTCAHRHKDGPGNVLNG